MANNTVIVEFTPKYHAEIAGEGVECGWGFAKKIHQRMPLKLKRDFGDFTKTVRNCLLKVTPERSRRFRRHCRKYMLAYAKIAEEAKEQTKEVASAPFGRIEALVKCCYASVDSERNQKKKRKKTMDLKSKKTELKQIVSIPEAYNQRNAKCRAIRSEDDEQIRLDRIAGSNGDVNVEAQQRTKVTHRSAMDTETTYLENEVELYLLDEEQQDG
jgi:2-methylcitrate dehydratase PrpD